MTITRRSLLTALAASPLAACVPVEPREVQMAGRPALYESISPISPAMWRAFEDGLITENEMRAMAGLRPRPDDLLPLETA